LGIYEGELRHVVLKMKHSTGEALAINMARLLAHCRAEELTALKADCVVPIPMFWTRKLRRGINSAEVLAEFLARDLGLPCHRRALARVRNTMHQMELPPKKRKPSSNPSIGVRWGRN
jgi:predicted amidophosphoribosyltransferase